MSGLLIPGERGSRAPGGGDRPPERPGLSLLPRLLTCVSPPPAAAAHLAQSDCAGDNLVRMRNSK